jgi:hypothetical protein
LGHEFFGGKGEHSAVRRPIRQGWESFARWKPGA